jgi:hypothetical protein
MSVAFNLTLSANLCRTLIGCQAPSDGLHPSARRNI